LKIEFARFRVANEVDRKMTISATLAKYFAETQLAARRNGERSFRSPASLLPRIKRPDNPKRWQRPLFRLPAAATR
jgi:hypothetical protein